MTAGTLADAPDAVADVFAALADGHRRELLDTLGRGGAASSSALAPRLGISRQAVDKHLKLLGGVGLVESRRAGREVLYEVRDQPLRDTADWLTVVAAGWDRRLAAIKRAAERG